MGLKLTLIAGNAIHVGDDIDIIGVPARFDDQGKPTGMLMTITVASQQIKMEAFLGFRALGMEFTAPHEVHIVRSDAAEVLDSEEKVQKYKERLAAEDRRLAKLQNQGIAAAKPLSIPEIISQQVDLSVVPESPSPPVSLPETSPTPETPAETPVKPLSSPVSTRVPKSWQSLPPLQRNLKVVYSKHRDAFRRLAFRSSIKVDVLMRYAFAGTGLTDAQQDQVKNLLSIIWPELFPAEPSTPNV